MVYRDWQIQAFCTYLGYRAECTPPVGHAVGTSDWFSTAEQALDYGRLMVDQLVQYEKSRLTASQSATVLCN